ncbi:MAG: hypothetical protein R3D59_01985 [Paracoccaceae bacterium]|nr:hypothetical protein [Maritimibacter sp.]
MKRLTICAFGALVITATTAMAQDAQTGTETPYRVAGLYTADSVPVRIGVDKLAPRCPEFCAPVRVTAPEQATVGEREVLSYMIAAAAGGPKLNVDSRRSLWAQAEKFPSTASPDETLNLVTQNEFRPALDPVLAGPTTDQAE